MPYFRHLPDLAISQKLQVAIELVIGCASFRSLKAPPLLGQMSALRHPVSDFVFERRTVLHDSDPMRNVTIHTLRHTFGSWPPLRAPTPLRALEPESENEHLLSLPKTTEKLLKPATGAGLSTFEVMKRYEVYRNKTGNKVATWKSRNTAVSTPAYS